MTKTILCNKRILRLKDLDITNTSRILQNNVQFYIYNIYYL